MSKTRKGLGFVGVMLFGWVVGPFLLVGCDNTTTTTPPAKTADAAPGRFTAQDQEMPAVGVLNITVYTDTKTGCEFLYLHDGEGNAATYIPHTCREDQK